MKEDLELKMKKYIFNTSRRMIKSFNENLMDPIDISYSLIISTCLYNIKDKSYDWEYYGYECCKRIKFFLESNAFYKNNISMISGLGLHSMAVNYYKCSTGNLSKFNVSLHQFYLSKIKEVLCGKSILTPEIDDFDCISGVSGVLNYIINFQKENPETLTEEIDTLIVNMRDYLIELSRTKYINGRKIIKYYTPSQKLLFEEEKEEFPNGLINLGVAHGILGPMISLSKLLKTKYETNDMSERIQEMLKIYEDSFILIGEDIYWPGRIALEDYIDGNKNSEKLHLSPSWCYGNIGILQGLIVICKNLNDINKINFYQNKLERFLSKDIKEYFLVSPCACHGYAGILSAMNIFKNNDFRKDALVKKIIELCIQNNSTNNEYIEEEIIEGSYTDYSLLSGSGGISLIFLESLTGIDVYRKLMMI